MVIASRSAVTRTGQATLELGKFKKVIGSDVSQSMVDAARQKLASADTEAAGQSTTDFEFVQSPAEDMSYLKDSSTDLVISGTLLASFPAQMSSTLN